MVLSSTVYIANYYLENMCMIPILSLKLTMNLYNTFDKRNFRMEGSCDGHLLYNHTGSCYVPSVDETMLEPIV